MITNLNNLTGTKTTGADMSQLVEQLARKADANGDGNVSSSEFSTFLGGLLESLGANAATGNGLSAKAAAMADLPAGTKATPAQPGHMHGFNETKWNDASHQTPKYVVGRLLAEHPPTPQGLVDALPSIQQAIPGTVQVGQDKLDIPGVGIVDVGLQFASGGGVGWWWGVD